MQQTAPVLCPALLVVRHPVGAVQDHLADRVSSEVAILFSFQSPHFNLSRMKGICFPAERQHFENRPTTYCCQCAVEHEKPRVCGLLCGGVDTWTSRYFYISTFLLAGGSAYTAALNLGRPPWRQELELCTWISRWWPAGGRDCSEKRRQVFLSICLIMWRNIVRSSLVTVTWSHRYRPLLLVTLTLK